jgi:hypothetical protein
MIRQSLPFGGSGFLVRSRFQRDKAPPPETAKEAAH